MSWCFSPPHAVASPSPPHPGEERNSRFVWHSQQTPDAATGRNCLCTNRTGTKAALKASMDEVAGSREFAPCRTTSLLNNYYRAILFPDFAGQRTPARAPREGLLKAILQCYRFAKSDCSMHFSRALWGCRGADNAASSCNIGRCRATLVAAPTRYL